TFYLAKPALHDAIAVSRSGMPGLEEYRLVDRSTGRSEPLPLPGEQRWACLSVAPWRDQAGNLEAVGRWSRIDSSNGHSFCGLGLFSLASKSVVRRIELDVLPTGKPCWIPDRPGAFLFPAGDGQLYRCRLSREDDSDSDAPNGAEKRFRSDHAT